MHSRVENCSAAGRVDYFGLNTAFDGRPYDLKTGYYSAENRGIFIHPYYRVINRLAVLGSLNVPHENYMTVGTIGSAGKLTGCAPLRDVRGNKVTGVIKEEQKDEPR